MSRSALWWLEECGPGQWDGLDMRALRMDEAYVRVFNQGEEPLWLYSLSEDCHECPYSRVAEIPVLDSDEPKLLTVSSARAASWRLYSGGLNRTIPRTDTGWAACEVPARLGEFGVYDLKVNGTECMLHTARQPANVLLPLAGVLVGLLALAVLHGAVSLLASCCGRRKRRLQEAARAHPPNTATPSPAPDLKVVVNGRKMSDPHPPPPPPPPPAPTPARRRVRSIDVFRGISIILMIFVNDGAGGYWFLEHATWDGLYVGDLVFPWFLWIMGVCIPLSVRPQLSKGVSRCTLLANIVKRSCVLFLLGLMVSSVRTAALEELRVMGVLQRLAVSYLVTGSLAVLLTPRQTRPASKGSALAAVHDVVLLLPQWLLVLALAAGHLAVLLVLEVPDCPRGYMGPGGVHRNGEFASCPGGAAGYVDRLLLGEEHLYPNHEAHRVYGSGPFDPEGLLGCLSSVLQVFLGVQAGTTILSYTSWRARLGRWFCWAVFLAVAGALSWYFGGIPINKNLWTLPYVLLTGSSAFLLLCGCYLLVDVWRCWTGSPFLYPGMNALVMYVGHMVLFCQFPFHWRWGLMNTHLMHLLENLWGTLLWIIVAVFLYRKKVFISV